MSNLAPMMSSNDTGWCTPAEVIELLSKVANIALDPCSNEHSIVGADRSISLPDDGLAAEWSCEENELIYCNPPYGREIAPWTNKCADTGVEHNVVALVPARTDTRWWQDSVSSAAAVCFWRGRLRFSGHSSPAPFPSAIVLWTWRQVTILHRFKQAFAPRGQIVGNL